MKAACMNAVRDQTSAVVDAQGQFTCRSWIHCGWFGEIESLSLPCPLCLNAGRLAPVVEVPE